MEYEVTEERKAYLDARGYTILSACPGSGKTTSIVKKLYDISAYCKQQYGTHTGFACLSFTNKACGELKSKYVEMHRESLLHPNVVSTIDSFIMQYVILPFWYLCDFCKSKPIVVNEKEILSKVYLNHVMVNGKMNEYKVMALRPYNDLFYKYPPETVRRKYKGFCFGNGPIVTDEKENNYCEAAFNHRLSKGIITSQDALWIAFYIISKHKHIAEIIISRFPYIIVDEAQDNSYLQFAFFEKLKQAGLKNLEYVEDICQSIYGFRNAYPKALQSLMKNKEWNTLHFTECRRSNQRIIDLYSKLKPSFIPQIKSHNVDDKNIPIIIYRYDNTNKDAVIRNFQSICREYALNDSCILARGENMCKLLAGVTDLKFRYWKSPIPYYLIDAKLLYAEKQFDKAFDKIRITLAELLFEADNYAEKKDFLLDIKDKLDWNIKILRFIKMIPSLSMSFAEWTQKMQQQLFEYWKLSELPDFQVYSRKAGYTMKKMSKEVVEKFHSSDDKASVYRNYVNTIHSVKGASMDAVLLFLSEKSTGQNISLSDLPIAPITEMTEKQRLIYVACSRAKHFLAIAVPASVSIEKIEKVLNNTTYEIRQSGLQLSFKMS